MTDDDIKYTQSALIKLREQIDSGNMIVFEPEEAHALREWAIVLINMRGVFWAFRLLGSSAKYFLALGLAWLAFKAGFFSWIKEGIGK